MSAAAPQTGPQPQDKAKAKAQDQAKPTEHRGGGSGSRPGPRAMSGPLEKVTDDVWWAWGTTRLGPGVIFPRTMTVVRELGELVIFHPVLLPDAEQAKLEALGPIKHIVRLGAFHGLEERAYLERYGAAGARPRLWAPPGVDVHEGVKVDEELRPGGPLPLAGATLFRFDRSRTPETALLLPRGGGILLTCDSVQNWQGTTGCSLLGGLMARAMGFRGRACIGPGWRKRADPRDAQGLGPDFQRLLALPFRHVIGGHGPPIKDTAKDDLRARVERLWRPA